MRELGACIERSGADADRDRHAMLAVMTAELLRGFAQRFTKLSRIVEARRQQRRESIAGNARGKRARSEPAPNELAELPDHRVAHVHAEAVVHDVKLVCIDIESAPGSALLLSGEDSACAMLERGPG